jgi:hypothetical protein
MESIEIYCENNEKYKTAEVLSMSDKHLKVVFEGTTMTLDLTRTDLNKPYVGRKAGLEFTYGGKQ